MQKKDGKFLKGTEMEIVDERCELGIDDFMVRLAERRPFELTPKKVLQRHLHSAGALKDRLSIK